MTKDRVIVEHPSAAVGEVRRAEREGDFDAITAAIRDVLSAELSDEAPATVIVSATIGVEDDVAWEDQVRRAADAVINAYLPESWDRVMAAAMHMEEKSNRSEFARAVRLEVERRRNEQEST